MSFQSIARKVHTKKMLFERFRKASNKRAASDLKPLLFQNVSNLKNYYCRKLEDVILLSIEFSDLSICKPSYIECKKK